MFFPETRDSQQKENRMRMNEQTKKRPELQTDVPHTEKKETFGGRVCELQG